MIEQVGQTLFAVVVSIAFCLLYFAGTNFVIDKMIHLPVASKSKLEKFQNSLRPWAFLAPALLLLGVYLLYPLVETFRLSFYDDKGEADRKSTRLNSSHLDLSRMPSSA